MAGERVWDSESRGLLKSISPTSRKPFAPESILKPDSTAFIAGKPHFERF